MNENKELTDQIKKKEIAQQNAIEIVSYSLAQLYKRSKIKWYYFIPAFGMLWYWVSASTDCQMKDFFQLDSKRAEKWSESEGSKLTYFYNLLRYGRVRMKLIVLPWFILFISVIFLFPFSLFGWPVLIAAIVVVAVFEVHSLVGIFLIQKWVRDDLLFYYNKLCYKDFKTYKELDTYLKEKSKS